MPPSTLPLTLLTSVMTLSVISTPLSPSGSSIAYMRFCSSRCTPSPLSTEKLKAINGTTESRVVYTSDMDRSVS